MADEGAAPAASEKIETGDAGTTKPTTKTPAADAGVSNSGGKSTILSDALDGGVDDAVTTAHPSKFPDNWREVLAGKDAASLARYQSPEGVFKKLKALEHKLSTTRPVEPFPGEGSDEEKAEWRKAQGLPDTKDGYDTAIGDGVVWGEADKPLLDNFLGYAHANNYRQDEVTKSLKWYTQLQQEVASNRDRMDAEFNDQSKTALRADWGPEYTRNTNAVGNFLNTWPADVKARVLEARTPEGRRLADDPEFIKTLTQTAMEINPQSALLPPGLDIKGAQTRLQEIRSFRREHPDRYDGDKKMQAEEMEILEAELKMRSRGKSA